MIYRTQSDAWSALKLGRPTEIPDKPSVDTMGQLLTALKAIAEPTRLRLLAIFAHGEFTVSELTRVLHQSQPRVSRHLRLLCEAGLLDRFSEGAWAFYRLTDQGEGAQIARRLLELIPSNDPEFARDLEQIDAVRRERADRAATYFRENAPRWDRIRSLYLGESAVEQAMLEAAGQGELGDLVDLGTGTGRLLEVFAPRLRGGIGIDQSHEMLNVARANLDARGLTNCQVRWGDIYALPLPSCSADLVTLHHVLHFLGDPGAALREAARLLRPGGRLLVADFSPHELEYLRNEHAHRRLGFADEQVVQWCEAAGLSGTTVRHLEASGDAEHETLTVSLWTAERPASQTLK